MRADRLRPGDVVVLLGVKVGSVLVEGDLTFVTYDDDVRTGEVLASDRDVLIATDRRNDDDA